MVEMTDQVASTSFAGDETEMAFIKNGKRPASPQEPEPETKKRFKTKSLYRQPTVAEIARLNETEILFNSNLFRLQIEEILQEVKLNERVRKRFDTWFSTFEKYLNDISMPDFVYDLSENTLFKQLEVRPPVPKFFSKTVCMFKFQKFKSIKLIGSYALGCPIETNLVVDIEIKVPAEIYTKSDSVNYKYHKKRGAYLACIAAHLRGCDTVEELQYYWQDGVLHYPYLIGKPSGKLGNYVSFRIILTCEEEAYKLQRFAPSRNNLRESWLYETEPPENELGPPTPHYNSSVLRDLNAEANDNLLREVFLNQDNLKSAVVLIKIWLRQRELKVSGFLVHMFVAYLVRTKRINNMMSSYQIIRNVWVSIESSKWDTEGITMCKGTDAPPISEFLQHFAVVFLDETGYFNIAYEITKGIYQALKIEASLAIDMLDNRNSINSFVPLFMKTVQDLEQFDHIVRIKSPEVFLNKVCNSVDLEKQLNYGIDRIPLALDAIYSVLYEGLGDRVSLVLDKVEADYRCPVEMKLDRSRRDSKFTEKISIGFVLNSGNATNVVMKGPPANYPEAAKFRAFWGEKSEIRRFQDGSITEACVWDGESVAERRGITKQIVQFLFQSKFGIKPEETFYIADQLDAVLTRRELAPPDGIIGTGEELSLKVINAFNELRTHLRELTGLPLDVSGVYGSSPILSYTDPFPLIGQAKITNPWQRGNACLIKEVVRNKSLMCPDFTPVYEAVVELTFSGKWPGEIQAFRCLKAAFYVHISERIAEQFSLLAHPYRSHVDIVKNGVVFRLRIAHSKELTLLRRVNEGGVIKHRETEESTNYYRNLVLVPKLRGTLHGLHQKHPAYGPTTCLFKRFLSSHFLDHHHVSETVIELLVAYMFVHPEPYAAPVQPLAGFFRLLRLMADTDWANEMLLIDFNGDLTTEEKADIERQFTSLPPAERPPLHIVTSNDLSEDYQLGEKRQLGAVMSAVSPTSRVLWRVSALASKARDSLTQHLGTHYTDNVLGTFIPPPQDFDVTIKLRPDCIPYVKERVSVEPAPPRQRVDEAEWTVIPVVDFQPVRTYLSELRSAYDEFAVFFYDIYGGETIGVIWKTETNGMIDFQIATANATMPLNMAEEKERNKKPEKESHKRKRRGSLGRPVKIDFWALKSKSEEKESLKKKRRNSVEEERRNSVEEERRNSVEEIESSYAILPETQYTINKDAIIEDFKILGEGLVTEVIVERK